MDQPTATILAGSVVAVVAGIPAIIAAFKSNAANNAAQEAKTVSAANGEQVAAVRVQNEETRSAIDGRLTALLEAVKAVARHEGAVEGIAQERARANEETSRLAHELQQAQAATVIAEAAALALKTVAEQAALAKLSAEGTPAAVVPPPQVFLVPQAPQTITGEVRSPGTDEITGELTAELQPTKEPAP